MKDTEINQIMLIPLFNVELEEPLHLEIKQDQCVDRYTYKLFPRPIRIIPGKPVIDNTDNKPIEIPVTAPRINIHFYPWKSKDNMANEVSDILPINQLPADFDTFDNLGSFALRGGGLQTVTDLHTKRYATTLLIVEFIQIYPAEIALSRKTSVNPYGINLTDSLLDAVRLISGCEPHQYKGYYFNDKQILNVITKWPLSEMQGKSVKLNMSDLQNLKNLLLQVWQIRRDSVRSKSCRIVNLALEYYYLSSTLTQTRTVFLYLMIAFEALFKARNENTASAASTRLAKLVANTKTEYNEIYRFIWNPKENNGCCQIRNQLVHGDFTSPPTTVFWRLRDLLRYAIVNIVNLILSSQIDLNNYYETLGSYANNRFTKLSNS